MITKSLKHTPGPWTVAPQRSSAYGRMIIEARDDDGDLVTLAALQDIAAEMAAGVINPHCVSRARAAIAKAVQS